MREVEGGIRFFSVTKPFKQFGDNWRPTDFNALQKIIVALVSSDQFSYCNCKILECRLPIVQIVISFNILSVSTKFFIFNNLEITLASSIYEQAVFWTQYANWTITRWFNLLHS